MATESRTAHWHDQLTSGLQQMGLQLDTVQQRSLLDYLLLLSKWNNAFNLTAVRDPSEMVSRQLLDSLSILPLLSGSTLLDVGTGAGLPGVPLAIARPDISFTLLDSNGKKCRFVEQAKIELCLENVRVERCRIEQFLPAERFEMVVSRAFAALPEMLDLCSHLISKKGCLLAMKGALHSEEMKAIAGRCAELKVHRLNVAACAAQRHAVVCRFSD